MMRRLSLWNSLAFFIGFVNMSATLSAPCARTALGARRIRHVADEEVAPLDVLHAIVMLRVVRDVASALRVRSERGGARFGRVETADEFAEVDHVLSALRERDDLGLARRESDARLLPRAPVQSGSLPLHDPPRGRGGRLPRRVGVATEASGGAVVYR